MPSFSTAQQRPKQPCPLPRERAGRAQSPCSCSLGQEDRDSAPGTHLTDLGLTHPKPASARAPQGLGVSRCINLRCSFCELCDLGEALGGMELGGTRPQSLSPGTYLDLRKASSSGSCTVGRKLQVRKNHREHQEQKLLELGGQSPHTMGQLLPPTCDLWEEKAVCWAEGKEEKRGLRRSGAAGREWPEAWPVRSSFF